MSEKAIKGLTKRKKVNVELTYEKVVVNGVTHWQLEKIGPCVVFPRPYKEDSLFIDAVGVELEGPDHGLTAGITVCALPLTMYRSK